ncbi:MAG TPA: PfkB family carbohydrate kinase [Candidatus Limnocylindria bacterium]|nr:PfkB family carbohydrate kinase [Candidatus Limnocylindria bacterium]
MIAVVGQPAYRQASDTMPGGATGPAVGVARAAVAAGASAQIIGKVGADHTGDVLLLDLARAGIGHAAVLRDPGRPTSAAPSQTDAETDEDPDEGPILDPSLEEHDEDPQARAKPADSRARLTLDPADVELGLRYLTGYRVVVAAEPLAEATLAVVAEAAAYAGAHLVVVMAPGSVRPMLDPSIAVTLLEAPPDDPDEQFASLVGRYAAALDAGVAADEAFRAALSPSGWEPVPPAT